MATSISMGRKTDGHAPTRCFEKKGRNTEMNPVSKATSFLKAIGCFDAARKFQHDCGGNLWVKGGQIWLHLPAANMEMSEALR